MSTGSPDVVGAGWGVGEGAGASVGAGAGDDVPCDGSAGPQASKAATRGKVMVTPGWRVTVPYCG